jgi:hypothetical protein
MSLDFRLLSIDKDVWRRGGTPAAFFFEKYGIFLFGRLSPSGTFFGIKKFGGSFGFDGFAIGRLFPHTKWWFRVLTGFAAGHFSPIKKGPPVGGPSGQ